MDRHAKVHHKSHQSDKDGQRDSREDFARVCELRACTRNIHVKQITLLVPAQIGLKICTVILQSYSVLLWKIFCNEIFVIQ